MIYLFYDSETSDMPLWHEPSEHEGQPHIVQLGAALVDAGSRRTVASVDLIAKPVDWIIEPGAAAVHGITTDYARSVGLPEQFLVHCLWSLWELADVRIGYNESFDARMMRIALKRYAGEAPADEWKNGKAECAMRMASPIVQMPATVAMKRTGRGKQSKNPKLSEAYQYFMGKELEGAHSAMVDVQACMDVYWNIVDHHGPDGGPG